MSRLIPVLGAVAMLALLCGLAWPFRPGWQSNDGPPVSLTPTPGAAATWGPPAARDPYIVIDRYCNRLLLRTNSRVLLDASCSVGSGAELVDTVTGRSWRFDTPAGTFKVESKLQDPWWRKPDWVFVEEGSPLPKSEEERFDSEMLGEYALGFGNGYFIHGTMYKRLLGISVTHGCVRLDDEDLRRLYEQTKVGTRVYVY